MRAKLTRLFLLGVLALMAGPAAAQQPLDASLSFVSDPGDYVGGGQSRLFTIEDASITPHYSDNGGHFGLTVFPFSGGFWFLDLAAPQGSRLEPGAYESAVRYPFQSPSQPGLSLFGDGRGCNTLTGRFDVLDAAFGPNGYIERLHARFEQHCEGGVAALYGEVNVVNPPPPPPLQIFFAINEPAGVDKRTGKARVTGTISCTIATSVGINAALNQRLTRFALATANAFTYIPCAPNATSWALDVIPQGNVPFGAGMAQLDLAMSGYDSYYGQFVSTSSNEALRLNPSR
jgi:hypothetical protein